MPPILYLFLFIDRVALWPLPERFAFDPPEGGCRVAFPSEGVVQD